MNVLYSQKYFYLDIFVSNIRVRLLLVANKKRLKFNLFRIIFYLKVYIFEKKIIKYLFFISYY